MIFSHDKCNCSLKLSISEILSGAPSQIYDVDACHPITKMTAQDTTAKLSKIRYEEFNQDRKYRQGKCACVLQKALLTRFRALINQAVSTKSKSSTRSARASKSLHKFRQQHCIRTSWSVWCHFCAADVDSSCGSQQKRRSFSSRAPLRLPNEVGTAAAPVCPYLNSIAALAAQARTSAYVFSNSEFEQIF